MDLSNIEDGEDVHDAIEWLEERGAVEVEWIDTVENPRAGADVRLKAKGKTLHRQFIAMEKSSEEKAISTVDPRAVFVIHGRNTQLNEAIFAFLRAIGLSPMEWGKLVAATGTGTPYIGDIIKKGFELAHAAVVLLSPDDEARLCTIHQKPDDPAFERELTPQARPNVIFEAGMAFATHPQRTVIVQVGNLRPFSDIAGLHIVRMDGSPAERQNIAHRLRDAGCPVDLDGTHWYTTGDFILKEQPAKDANPQ